MKLEKIVIKSVFCQSYKTCVVYEYKLASEHVSVISFFNSCPTNA